MSTATSYTRSPGSGAKDQLASVPKKIADACVMVAEDHEDTRFLLRTMLEMRGGISVIEAANGEMALALAMNVHIDLILMDLDLPLLDGYTATRRLRELAATRDLPIIIISGHAQPAAEAKAFAAGCTDYLVKPFALCKLGGVLERHLARNKAN